MAVFDTKFGRLYAERSEKGGALHVGLDGEEAKGFVSLPFGERELLRAACVLGAALTLRKARRGKKASRRAQKGVARSIKRARAEFAKRGGFGGKRR